MINPFLFVKHLTACVIVPEVLFRAGLRSTLWVCPARRAAAVCGVLAAGPFLAPYVLQFTWSACLVGLLEPPLELLAAVVCLWVPVILRVFS